jgi:hypothetical protein
MQELSEACGEYIFAESKKEFRNYSTICAPFNRFLRTSSRAAAHSCSDMRGVLATGGFAHGRRRFGGKIVKK